MSKRSRIPTDEINPFERHGIQHLSPSALALYRHSPALWCLRYLFGVKDEAGPYAWRGRAVEAGVDAIVMDDADDYEAIERAKQAFETEARGEIAWLLFFAIIETILSFVHIPFIGLPFVIPG